MTIVLENVYYRYPEGGWLSPGLRQGATGATHNPQGAQGSWVLQEINLRIPETAMTLVIGPNGSGKSTLLGLIAGLDQPNQGRIYLEAGEADWRSRLTMGLVLQYPERQLFAPTVFEDIAFGPRQHGVIGSELEQRVMAAMAAVGLDPKLAGRSPFSLSSGEKRRAALAGVLALDPKLLLLDEPTAGLDRAGRLELLTVLRRWRGQGRGVILATHDWEDFLPEADGVILLGASRAKQYSPQGLRGGALCFWPEQVDGEDLGRSLRSDSKAGESQPKLGLWALDPRAKLLFAFLFTLGAVVARGWSLLVPLSLGVLAWSLGVASGISWRHAFRSLRPLAFILVATAGLYLFFTPGAPIFRWGAITVTWEGLISGGILVLRLGVLLATLALLILTSSPPDLADGLSRLLGPLKRIGLPVEEVALALTMAMRFFPQIGEEASAIYQAQRARGLDLSRGSLRERIQKLSALVVPLLVGAFRRADELAEAMEARGWRAEGRTRYRPLRFGNADYVTLGLGLAGLAAVLWLRGL